MSKHNVLNHTTLDKKKITLHLHSFDAMMVPANPTKMEMNMWGLIDAIHDVF